MSSRKVAEECKGCNVTTYTKMKKALNEFNAIDENTISMKDNEREELDLFITQRFIADELEQARRLLTK